MYVCLCKTNIEQSKYVFEIRLFGSVVWETDVTMLGALILQMKVQEKNVQNTCSYETLLQVVHFLFVL